MITFHHSPRARSVRLIWLLEELGLPYEAKPVEFNRERLRSPEYMALHPLGQIPVLQDGDVTMFESGAIVDYLLERYGAGRLVPKAEVVGWPARAEYLQWFQYGEATIAKHAGDIVRNRFGEESERIPALLEQARLRLRDVTAVVDRALEGRDFICGAEFTAADIMLSYSITLMKIMSELPREHANVAAYLGRLRQRPGYAKAWG